MSSRLAEQANITHKQKKMQGLLAPYGQNARPIMSTEMAIEEAFIDIFCGPIMVVDG
jgi:hypothetical protein